jgi:three-Cys-motif partner protein
MPRVKERYWGGPWTELKLDAVEYYLCFYTVALKGKFELWYIDAFAGSGEREVRAAVGGLFDGRPVEEVSDVLAGSAKRALAVEPQFDKLIFIEGDEVRFAALKALESAHPDRDIDCRLGDSNEALLALLKERPWSTPRPPNRGARGVLFLDPFSMTVPWQTLEAVAATKAFDVWYLFPLAATVRQLARDYHFVDEAKAASLDRIFGTTSWRQEMYQPRSQATLLDLLDTPERSMDVHGIEAWFAERLRTIFAYVPEAIPILTPNGARLFSLFFAMANDEPRARKASENCMRSLVKKFGAQASRRTSGR